MITHFLIYHDEQTSPDKQSSVPNEGTDVDSFQKDGEVSQQTVEGDVSEVLLAHQGGRRVDYRHFA